MMSSEEETDCFALYGDKLLKKAKRARQRVDAGEPRNSYSSIPNFTSRPGFMSGGIYGAIFNQGRQHFGLFGPGYAPGKMLNELLGRPPKTEDGGGEDATAGGELAHHVLRDILHGRKKELLQLERELRAAASPDNNNSLANNNNDEPKDKADADSGDEASAAAAAMRDCLREAGLAGKRELLDDSALGPDCVGDSRSLPSPPSVEALVTPKVELDADTHGKESPRSLTPVKDQVPLEAKRARVENIVSTMRSSPAPPSQPQVNGCKKRKLYHPQQHESAAERYAAGALALGLQGLLVDDEDDDGDRPPIQQKLVEKNALKTQLRSMQEQLAEMQQKYVQLCNRMEQESETHDDATSDDATEREPSEPAEKPTPASSPAKEAPPPPPPPASAPSMLSQVMSKMMSAKVHGHVPHGHALPPGFNGALPLVPHLAIGGHEHHPAHHAPHPHHAAAVYLGVSQKIFMEQEARMVKEAAQAAEHRQHQHQHAMQQHAMQQQQSQQHSPSRQSPSGQKPAPMSAELAERLNALRVSANSVGPVSGADLEGLAEVLKSEITASLTGLVDSIVSRFVHQRRFIGKQSEAAAAAAEQLNKDLMLASQLLERRSPPRVKSAERLPGPHSGSVPHMHQSVPITSASMIPNSMNSVNFVNHHGVTSVSGVHANGPRVNGAAYPQMMHASAETPSGLLSQNPHGRPPPSAMFQTPKPPQGLGSAAAALYGSMNGMSPFCSAPEREPNPEQNEALSLVVTPKKKRHKVTDTRITPRTVSRILAQDGLGPSPAPDSKPFADSPSPRPYHAPPSLALPTSVAIPNPSLHESQVFSPYSPFFGAHAHAPARAAHSPLDRDSPPLPHAPALLHPALLAAAHHASPDYGLRQHLDHPDPHSDCNSTDIAYDGIQPTISFSIPQVHSSTLTPMHLRKAKLMFFWVRYPSSAVLKMYFPDIKFNKNNTAQLVKWFSNFREFYYIQMEKYARQAISEGMKNADELHVAGDSEIYRVLNLHYNRNNHIEVPSNFRYVVEQTLREFFRAIQGGKDSEQSWKKSIYKIISRLDDPVPEYFKSPNFLEQLE